MSTMIVDTPSAFAVPANGRTFRRRNLSDRRPLLLKSVVAGPPASTAELRAARIALRDTRSISQRVLDVVVDRLLAELQ